jgi:hypothetical protein
MSHERTFDKKFGDFYEGLKTKSRAAMQYNYIFVLRRFLFVITAFYWYDLVGIQIGFFVFTTEIYCMYLVHAQPFTDRATNRQEIFNEITVFVVTYHLICLSDFVRSAETKFDVGYSLIATVIINLCFGLGNIGYLLSHKLRVYIKRKLMLRKDKKIREMIILKYSPFAQQVILGSIRNKRSIEEELIAKAKGRQHFIDNYLNKFDEASCQESIE